MNRKSILERKLMGIPYYFPYLLYICLFFLSLLFHKQEYGQNQVTFMYEMSIPFFVCWWSIYSLYDYLEEDGSIVLFTYQKEMHYFVLKNNFYLTLKYIIQSGIFISLNMSFLFGEIDFRIQTSIFIESIFFSAASIFLMSLLSDSNWSLMILFIYVCAGFFTDGELLGSFNIFLYRHNDITWQVVFQNCSRCIFFSALFYSVGIYVMKKSHYKF